MIEIRQILGWPDPVSLDPEAGRALARTFRPALARLCAAALLILAGCGQKGPLYLPDGQVSTAPPAPSTPAKIKR